MQLNWNLNDQEERLKFIQDLPLEQLSPAQLERIADYLLWPSPDAESMGLVKWNWSGNTPVSLEAIQEQGLDVGNAPIIAVKAKQGRLERSDVYQRLGQNHPLTPQWLDLWRRIDETEFMVQVWELSQGKRRADLPIRDELFIRLWQGIHGQMPIGGQVADAETNNNMDNNIDLDMRPASISDPAVQIEQARRVLGAALIDTPFKQYIKKLCNEALAWEGYKALKKKRQLVTLRTEQYTLLDCLSGESVKKHTFIPYTEEIKNNDLLGFRPFMSLSMLIDSVDQHHFSRQFTSKCLDQLSWADSETYEESGKVLDLRNGKTLKSLLNHYYDIEDLAFSGNYENKEIFFALYSYLNYYIKRANLDDDMTDILYMKMNHKKNKEIADYMEKRYGLIYGENYISTIVTNRIIKPILEEIDKHYKLLEYLLVGPSVFKKCSCCGKMYPRNATYFLKRKSCSDGFYSVCKECNKEKKKDAKKNEG